MSTINESGNSATFMDVARRCIRWGDYVEQYPNSLLIKEAQDFYDIYLSALMTGTEYTMVLRVSDFYPPIDSKRVLPIYDYVIKKRPKSRAARVLYDYIPVLKANNFCDTPGLREYFEKNNMEFAYGFFSALGKLN